MKEHNSVDSQLGLQHKTCPSYKCPASPNPKLEHISSQLTHLMVSQKFHEKT